MRHHRSLKTLPSVAPAMQDGIWDTRTYCLFSFLWHMSLLPSTTSSLPAPLTGPTDHQQHIQLLFSCSSFLEKGESQEALGLPASQLWYQRISFALALAKTKDKYPQPCCADGAAQSMTFTLVLSKSHTQGCVQSFWAVKVSWCR